MRPGLTHPAATGAHEARFGILTLFGIPGMRLLWLPRLRDRKNAEAEYRPASDMY